MPSILRCRGLKLAAATSFLAFILSASLAQTRGPNPLKPTEVNIALGLDHFNAHCAECHGEMGKSETDKGKALKAADLTSEQTQSKTDRALHEIISRGRPGTAMPAFGKSHTATEIWQTILFLRKLPTLTDEEKRKLEAAIPPGARHKPHVHKPDEKPKKPQAEERDHQHREPQATTQQPHAAKPPTQQSQPAEPAQGSLTLADFERMALDSNPTLAQAEALIRAAEGRRKQAGLWPNPVVGYQGEEFAFRAFTEKSEHFFFIEQTIPLGGKLAKSRRVAEQEVRQANADATVQKGRVINTVRILFHETLAAQQRVQLRSDLARIAREAVQTTSELLNIGQADRPDYLESEIEAQQAEIDLANSRSDLEQAWLLLTAAVGKPDLKPALLAGDFEAAIASLDQVSLRTTLLTESPEIKSAKAQVERARAAVARAKAERAPDLFIRGGFGYSTELLSRRSGATDRTTGPEAMVEMGVTLPIFNRNQGGIAAAEAELAVAERDLQRLELALRSRLSQVFGDYRRALGTVERYKTTVMPSAQRAYDLYLAGFRQMAAAYPQVLIAQRTMFQVREKYLDALVELRSNAIRIEGFILTGALDPPGRR